MTSGCGTKELTGNGFAFADFSAYGDGWLHTLRPDADPDSM